MLEKIYDSKIIFSVSLAILAFILGIIIFMVMRAISLGNNLIDDKITVNANNLEFHLERYRDNAITAAVSMAEKPEAINAIREKNTEKLLKYFSDRHELYNINYYTITDNEGNVLARTHQPENFGDSIAGQKNITEGLAGRVSATFEPGVFVKVSARAGSPVYDTDGTLIGVILAGVRFDTNETVDMLKKIFNSDVTVIFGDTRIATTLMSGGERMDGSKLDPAIAKILLEDKVPYSGEVKLFGRRYQAYYRPILNSKNETFSAICLGIPTEDLKSEFNNLVLLTVIIGLMILILSLILLSTLRNTIAARKLASAANSAKSDFLANISHEMRTPLNAVLGLSSLTLEMEGLNNEASSNIEKIYSSGATLLSIVNDILDISKIEAGKLELIPNEYDIPSLVNDIITQNILRKGSKLIDFKMDISEDIPVLLYGDELRIKQIFNNLLSNAFKYTKEGIVELGLRSVTDRNSESVWITGWVKDSGMGIKPEDIKKLFSEYSQVDTKANRKIEGTGLGLAITKKMIELMDGSITVESEYGKGTVFTVIFRQKFVSGTPIGKTVVNNLMSFRHSDAKRKKGSRIIRIQMPYANVLVVDDNITNLDVAKGLMKPYGIQVDCITSGRQAIDAILKAEVKYDAVFMDHMMPEMDGIEATRQIREINNDYAKNIPIIALTANAIEGNEEKFLSRGFQDFLSKPIDILRLDEALRRWVRNKEKEKEIPVEQKKENREKPAVKFLEGKIIDGIDLEKGLEHFDGNEETYLNVLRSYMNNNRPVLEFIREAVRETLAYYSINVHGLKGASRGIFAEKIGEMAEELEMASKAGDYDFVKKNNGKLIEAAEKLMTDIGRMLAAIDSENKKTKKDKPDSVTLQKLASACKDYDIDGINGAMAEIQEFEYENFGSTINGVDPVVWLKDNILEGNFDEIAEKLKELIDNE